VGASFEWTKLQSPVGGNACILESRLVMRQGMSELCVSVPTLGGQSDGVLRCIRGFVVAPEMDQGHALQPPRPLLIARQGARGPSGLERRARSVLPELRACHQAPGVCVARIAGDDLAEF